MILMYVILGALIIASLIIQGHSSFDVLRIGGVKPDLVFIIVVYIAYSFGSLYGQVSGFIGGILHDALSNSPLGLLAFPKMALGFIVGFLGRSILKENLFTIFLLIFFASIVKGILTLILSFLFHHGSISAVTIIILPESFYNALLSPPLFYLFDKIFEQELSRERR